MENIGNILQDNYNNNGIDMYTIRQNIRYKLVSMNTQQNFMKWLSQGNTMDLIDKLIDQVKNNNLSIVKIIIILLLLFIFIILSLLV